VDPGQAVGPVRMSSRVLSSHPLRLMAQSVGFDLCGFARAEPIPAQTLSVWLEAGMAADMDWMHERVAERLDVGLLVPNARTVVALACNYFHPDPPTGPSPIARYARGRDYHYTLKDRLRALRRKMREAHPGISDYSSVDAAPVMEKVWAARAGLGYVARNGCLVTPEFGSYVVLATLILDVEVDAYATGQTEDRCGNCNLCVNACPTEAIVADATVDACKCLSYQTIENAAQVPSSLRFAFQNLAFGCDICQEVCPLNDSPILGGDRFAPRKVAGLSVLDLAGLSQEQYAALIPGTPLARAKYDGLRRNALYALGATRNESARGVIERLVRDPSEPVREAASWALQQLD
jgi:epoxyqueuosine reductase